MPWNDKKPQGTDPLSEYPSMLTNQLTSIASAMEQHFYWTVRSGASAGIPALSTITGSARAYFGTQSQVSSSTATTLVKAQAGRLMLTSDTTRLYMIQGNSSVTTGTGPVLLGSDHIVANYGASFVTVQTDTRWLEQCGVTSGVSCFVNTHVAFPSQYSVTPIVQVTCSAQSSGSVAMAFLTGLDKSGFTVTVSPAPTTITASPLSTAVYWISTGTVAL